MKNLSSIFAIFVFFSAYAHGTVSIEFQLGAAKVPPGSLGVLVADTTGNGFRNPGLSPGALLNRGSRIGTDDVIVAVFPALTAAEWGGGQGFSTQPEVIDYSSLGVSAGQAVTFYVFPLRQPGNALRSGEPHLSYRTETLAHLTPNSSMQFVLPPDGGAYALGALGPTQGGGAELASIDIAPLDLADGNDSSQRNLPSGASHTLFFEIMNPSATVLESTADSGVFTRLYDAAGQLVAESDGSGGLFSFSGQLSTGFHSVVMSRSPGAPGSGFYDLEITAEVEKPRPDIAVGRSLSSAVGFGVIGSSASQSISITSRGANRVEGVASIRNAGKVSDRILLRGTAGTSLFGINYTGPTGNITAAVTTGSYRSAAIKDDSSPEVIRVLITPNKRKLIRIDGARRTVLRKTFTVAIRASSGLNPASPDNAEIKIRTR